MKTKFLILILCLPFFGSAQKFSNRDKALINTRIDSLLTNYMTKSTLTDPTKMKISDKVVAQFKKLFALEATVFDDLFAKFDPAATGYPYILETKTRNEYIDDLVMEFENGLIVNNRRININYAAFDSGMVHAALEREVYGVSKTEGYRFSNHDTLLISVVINPDKTVKIAKIESMGHPQVKISNDMDFDGVIDEKDECKEHKGMLSLKGCPDSDKDGIADKEDECPQVYGIRENGGCPASTFAYSFVFSGGIGYQFNNNNIKTPELDDYAYDNLDKSSGRSTTGEISSPDYQGSLTINGNLGYYFGKKKNNRNKGISLGFSATNYKASYDISGAKFEYKSNDGVDDYRRVVTMIEGHEEINYSIINIPLLLRYKEKFSPKAGFEIFAGPSFTSLIASTEYRTRFSFEGIYQFGPNGTFIYDNNFNETSTDVYFTATEVNGHLFITPNAGGPNVDELFSLMNGYDFDMDKEINGSDGDLDTHSGFAFNGGADLFYHVTKKMAVKLGAYVIISGVKNSESQPYIMVDDTDDSYNSIYRSKANSTYTALNFNIGIILGI